MGDSDKVAEGSTSVVVLGHRKEYGGSVEEEGGWQRSVHTFFGFGAGTL